MIAAATQGATAPRKAVPKPRPATLILAKYEHGPITVSITTDPAGWREEEIRLKGNSFCGFFKFPFESVDQAATAAQDLRNEVAFQFGDRAVTADQHLVKMFSADWPMVLDIFSRQQPAARAVIREAA